MREKEKPMDRIPERHPGYPDRYCMIRSALYMERRRYTYDEWCTLSRLCDTDPAIRKYLLAYLKEALNLWDGLEPSRGSQSHEIALIAAAHAYEAAGKECGSSERIKALLQPPEPWSEQQYADAQASYCKRSPLAADVRVTKKLLQSLERESSRIFKKPSTTTSGCNIILFPASRR